MQQLKEQGASEQELNRAVAELKARKKILEGRVSALYFTSPNCAPLVVCQ